MMKFGIILEGHHVDEWQYQVIQDTQKYPSSLDVIVCTRKPEIRQGLHANSIYRIWEKSQLKKTSPARVDLLSCSDATNATLLESEATAPLDAQIAEQIRSRNLDFILYFGSGAISGPILNAARLGVWSFHFGNEKKYRGQPACFWEMFDRAMEIEGTLLRLEEKPEFSVVLQRFAIPNHKYSLAENVNSIRKASIHMVRNAIVDIQNGVTDAGALSEGIRTQARSLPTNVHMVRFLALVTANLIKHVIQRVILSDHWHIAITNASVDQIMKEGIKKSSVAERGKILDFFYADPFIFTESDGSISVFAEKYDWRTEKGTIVKIDAPINGSAITEEKSQLVLELPVHLAYPSIIRAEGKTYLLPEAKKTGRVTLHEIDDAGTIQDSITIVDDVELNDPTILFHNSRYWLFGSTHRGELYIWHSENLTSGWKPHAKQPVLISPFSARAAGAIFVHNNEIIRPTQDWSEHYGKQVIFNKISRLDENSFVQEPIGKIPPITNGTTYDGLHTFNIGQKHIIFDLKIHTLDLLKPAREILKRIKRRARHQPA